MMLISEAYLKQNVELHRMRKDYGAIGGKWAAHVRELAEAIKTTDILDYGCGKGQLAMNLPYRIHQYDPAVPAFAATPEPAEIVVCTDVLEHVEPDCLDDVLEDVQRLTKQVAVVSVATRPAKKTLPDGSNAHAIIKPIEWWLPQLMEHFTLRNLNNVDSEFFCVLEAHRYA